MIKRKEEDSRKKSIERIEDYNNDSFKKKKHFQTDLNKKDMVRVFFSLSSMF